MSLGKKNLFNLQHNGAVPVSGRYSFKILRSCFDAMAHMIWVHLSLCVYKS